MTTERKPLGKKLPDVILGILRRRFECDVDEDEAKDLLLESLNLGSSVDSEQVWAKNAQSYWSWAMEMRQTIAKWRNDDSGGNK